MHPSTRTLVLWLMAASTVAGSVSWLPSTPFYQQSQYHNDLASLQGEIAQSPSGLLQQTAFVGSQFVSEDYQVDAEEEILMDDIQMEGEDEKEEEDESLDENGNTLKKHHKGWLYLIRHGEKVKKSDKTGLSERGVQRAKCLTDVFGSRGSRATYPIDYILAQDFKSTGQRRRPYETVKPLAKKHRLPLDHSCDRDDTSCAVRHIKKRTNRGQNVLVVWEHARLSHIANSLGVKGLVYPSDRYDIVFKIRGKKVHSIFSEECFGLDKKWLGWQSERKGKHGIAPHGGRLIDDESWAE